MWNYSSVRDSKTGDSKKFYNDAEREADKDWGQFVKSCEALVKDVERAGKRVN